MSKDREGSPESKGNAQFPCPLPLSKYQNQWAPEVAAEIEALLASFASKNGYTNAGKVLCILAVHGSPDRKLERKFIEDRLFGRPTDESAISREVGNLRTALEEHYRDRRNSRIELSIPKGEYRLAVKKASESETFWKRFAEGSKRVPVLFNTDQMWVSQENGSELHFGRPAGGEWEQKHCNSGSGEVFAVQALTRKFDKWGIDLKVMSASSQETILDLATSVIILGSELENSIFPHLKPPNRRQYSFELTNDSVRVRGTAHTVKRWAEEGTDYGMVYRWRDPEHNVRVMWLSASTTFGVQALTSWLLSDEAITQIAASVDVWDPDDFIEVLVKIEISRANPRVVGLVNG